MGRNLHNSPHGEPSTPSPRRLSQKYLDRKPLPIPTATPIPASASMPWPPPDSARSPRGGLSYGNSPRSRKSTPHQSPIKALSPSSWSPMARSSKRHAEHSGEVDTPTSAKSATYSPRSNVKRSPFKEIKNVFSGLRKGRGKDKEEPTGWGTTAVGMNGDKPHQFINLEDEGGWFAAPLRHPPAFMDRMGDAEMGLSMVNEEGGDVSVVCGFD